MSGSRNLDGVLVTREDSRAQYFGDLRPTGDVFLMTRFLFNNFDAHSEIVQVLQEELEGYGLRLTRADWRQLHDELWSNVCNYMDNAQFGIAIFDKFDDVPPSLNVSLELGYMLAKGKRCLLLRDKRVSMLQADLAGHLCHEFDPDDIRATVRSGVHTWLRDIGISKRPEEHLVFFVSSGGTCRDPMAKAILERIIDRDPPPFPLRIEARALRPHGYCASKAARKVVESVYEEDLLADHRPRQLATRHIDEADLILVMNDYLLKGLPEGKTFVINKFFGLPGNIADPWPDLDNAETLQRYATCLGELRQILDEGYPTLYSWLASRPAE